MSENRKLGLIVGILYIIGTVSGIMSVLFTGRINNLDEYFIQIISKKNLYVVGTLFVLCMGFSLAFIPIIIFPILKKQSKILAIGYVIFRGALETVIYIAIFVCMLLLLEIGKNINEFENIGFIVFKLRELCTLVLVYVFSIGALILYTGLYKSKLLPHWLSLWGIIAIILHFLTGVFQVFGLLTEESILSNIMNFPIFLQEMVMAILLIIKGFNSDFNKGNNRVRAYGT
jgi:hypothetical protein